MHPNSRPTDSVAHEPSLHARVNSAEKHLSNLRDARGRLESALNRLRTAPPRAAEAGSASAGTAPTPIVSLERRLELLDLDIKTESAELHTLANGFDQAI